MKFLRQTFPCIHRRTIFLHLSFLFVNIDPEIKKENQEIIKPRWWAFRKKFLQNKLGIHEEKTVRSMIEVVELLLSKDRMQHRIITYRTRWHQRHLFSPRKRTLLAWDTADSRWVLVGLVQKFSLLSTRPCISAWFYAFSHHFHSPLLALHFFLSFQTPAFVSLARSPGFLEGRCCFHSVRIFILLILYCIIQMLSTCWHYSYKLSIRHLLDKSITITAIRSPFYAISYPKQSVIAIRGGNDFLWAFEEPLEAH